MVGARLLLTLTLAVGAVGLSACSDDDGDDTGTTSAAEKAGEPILIKTHLAPVNASGETTGEVLSGSTIGDSAFCVGGRFGDRKEPGGDLVTRIFRCSGGAVTITFTSTPPDVEQRSDWEIVKGLDSYEGLSGGGRMRAVSESENGDARETFTGTATR